MVSTTIFRSAAVVLGLISLAASAQTATPSSSNSGRTRYSEPKFRMGLHLLPSVAWLDVRDTHSNSEGSVVRFGFGFTADIMFADNYAVGTGLNVFRNGGKVSHYDRVLGDPEDAANDSTAFLVRRERTLTQHWVEVPISFKFRTRQIGHITYWGQFGMGLGLNLRSTAKDAMDYRYRGEEGEEGTVWTEETVIAAGNEGVVVFDDVPVEDDVALLRAAMIVGLGIEYNLSGKTALLVGATFNNGLFNVASNKNYGPDRNEEHIQSAADGSLDPAAGGYDIKMVDNAILFSLGLLF